MTTATSMMSALRSCSSFSECALGESEPDANTLLSELDKAVRSSKAGDQCEAIVRFPKLFEKYPYPLLINTSFLKLAEVFRTGNNFLRLWVLRVFKQCESHLHKIIHIDEVVRRIFSVLHSNDPIGRAICLRILGSMARIISHRQQVHHSIRQCLDSHNDVEVEAAIYAAKQFAAQSKLFAISMCNKISDMIRGLTTPVQMKLQLIPILQHMHHDTSTAAMVRSVCTDLLSKYPAQNFVITTLKTLTELAGSTLVDIPDQVKLLVEYVANEPRSEVRATALECLHRLAKQGSQYWSVEAVSQLIAVAKSTQSDNFTAKITDIIIVLTQSPIVCDAWYLPDSALMTLCHDICLSTNPSVAGKAVRVIAQVTCYCYKEDMADICEENIDCVESYLLHITSGNFARESFVVSALYSAVLLCQAHKQLSGRFVSLIANRLVQNVDSSSLLLCKSLAAIGSVEPTALRAFLPDIFKIVRKYSSHSSEINVDTLTTLCTLLFQSCAGTEDKFKSELDHSVGVVLANADPWTCYKVARASTRYGHFSASYQLYSNISKKVTSEQFHFWLSGLCDISVAESTLADKSGFLIDRLDSSITAYHRALCSIKAGSTHHFPLTFQCEYVRLRIEFLHCLSRLLTVCNSFCLNPSPAIAAAMSHASRDDIARHAPIANQLRRKASDLAECAHTFWKLYQSAFDADSVTLLNIMALRYMCTYLSYVIESIVSPNALSDEPVLECELEEAPLDIQLLLSNCRKAYELMEAWALKPRELSHHHVSCFIKQIELVASTPMSYPRYFYQTIQSTSIQLSISPQQKSGQEFLTLMNGAQLTVKVEGIVRQGKRAGCFRNVANVVISVTSQLVTRSTSAVDIKQQDNQSQVLTQTAALRGDFFKAEFLLAFTCGYGQYQVVVEATLMDDVGFVWQTGVRHVLSVKTLEEVVKKKPAPAPLMDTQVFAQVL